MPDINIIIPVYNRTDFLQECIWSLLSCSSGFKLTIVDDNSDQKSREAINNIILHLKDVVLIRNETNKGFIKSVNRALKEFPAEISVILNSDTVVAPHWLDNLIAGFTAPYNFQLLGALTSSNSPYQNMQIPLADMALAEKYLLAYRAKSHKPEFEEVPYLYGTCLAIKRQVIETCGYFSEIYDRGYFEDVDYSFRAGQAGFKLGICNSSYVYHFQGKSFASAERSVLLRKNHQIFKSLWQKHPHYKFLPDYEKIISNVSKKD